MSKATQAWCESKWKMPSKRERIIENIIELSYIKSVITAYSYLYRHMKNI